MHSSEWQDSNTSFLAICVTSLQASNEIVLKPFVQCRLFVAAFPQHSHCRAFTDKYSVMASAASVTSAHVAYVY